MLRPVLYVLSPGLPGHETSVSATAISQDSNWLATGCGDGRVILWSLQEHSILREWNVDTPITFIEFSPDGRRVATPRLPGAGYEVTVRNVREGDLLGLLSGHAMPITTC